MSDLPSCVYTNQQLTGTSTSNLRINPNSLRQMQHQYLQHNNDCLDTSTNQNLSTNVGPYCMAGGGGNMSNISGSGVQTNNLNNGSYKIQRQQSNIRERKRMLRSAPNGYHILLINLYNFRFKTILIFFYYFIFLFSFILDIAVASILHLMICVYMFQRFHMKND